MKEGSLGSRGSDGTTQLASCTHISFLYINQQDKEAGQLGGATQAKDKKLVSTTGHQTKRQQQTKPEIGERVPVLVPGSPSPSLSSCTALHCIYVPVICSVHFFLSFSGQTSKQQQAMAASGFALLLRLRSTHASNASSSTHHQ